MFTITKKIIYLLSLSISFINFSFAMEGDKEIYTIIGANGQTGSRIARSLLDQQESVRVVLHKPEQAESWQELGADVRIADVGDKEALRKAFSGSHRAYLLNPAAYHHEDYLARSVQVSAAMVEAANEAGINYVVALSSWGGQLDSGTGVILNAHHFEQKIKKEFRGKSTIIRPAGFMENWTWVLGAVFSNSILPTMYLPVDRPMPMVSVIDIADVVTDCILNKPKDNSIIELYGPRNYSPVDAAEALSSILDKPIKAVTVPRENWASTFARSGFPQKTVELQCEMYDASNNGYLRFEGIHETRHGKVTLEEALKIGVKAYSEKTQKTSEEKK